MTVTKLKNNVTTQVVTITPKMAKNLLAQTEGRLQRVQHHASVLDLAGIIRRGEFKLNYQPIQVGVDGNVLDGKHRLHACVLANMPIEVLLVSNVGEDVFDIMDRGRSRTLGDILSSKNIDNYNAVAAGVSVLYGLINKRYSTTASPAMAGDMRKYRLSPPQLTRFLEENPGFLDHVSEALKVRRNGDKLVRQSSFVALWYYCALKDKSKADHFFNKISDGINLAEYSPIMFLRKRLIAKKSKQIYLTQKDTINLLLLSFKVFLKGGEIRKYVKLPKEPVSLGVGENLFKVTM